MESEWSSKLVGFGILGLIMALWVFRKYWFKRNWSRACEALRAGDLDTAERYLRRTLKSMPHVAFLSQTLGAVLARKGDLDEAEELYRMAAQLEPRNAQMYLHLGFFLALFRADRAHEAIQAFARAIEFDPDLRERLWREDRLGALRMHPEFETLIGPQTRPS
ncbi:MAG TPA: tetratricopeptide repeat protein [Candidatus Hydrogenedentes bacterium]|nr:tetratricopeptide repeat protein [Candidatus Hydrogenedentota bacterium]HPG65718.1 tetratricopeptide repeat protein [Candidatus Hydrogenedentota bacterium]